MYVWYTIECIELLVILVLSAMVIKERKLDGEIIFGVNDNGLEPSISVNTTLYDAIKRGYGRFTIRATDELADYISSREKETAQ